MPSGLVFHEVYAFSLDRMRHDHRRTVGAGLCLINRVKDLRKVISVELQRVPAK